MINQTCILSIYCLCADVVKLALFYRRNYREFPRRSHLFTINRVYIMIFMAFLRIGMIITYWSLLDSHWVFTLRRVLVSTMWVSWMTISEANQNRQRETNHVHVNCKSNLSKNKNPNEWTLNSSTWIVWDDTRMHGSLYEHMWLYLFRRNRLMRLYDCHLTPFFVQELTLKVWVIARKDTAS